MNGLGKKTSWVRFAKRGKKRVINGEKSAERGGFWVGTKPVNGVNVQLSRAGCASDPVYDTRAGSARYTGRFGGSRRKGSRETVLLPAERLI